MLDDMVLGQRQTKNTNGNKNTNNNNDTTNDNDYIIDPNDIGDIELLPPDSNSDD